MRQVQVGSRNADHKSPQCFCQRETAVHLGRQDERSGKREEHVFTEEAMAWKGKED